MLLRSNYLHLFPKLLRRDFLTRNYLYTYYLRANLHNLQVFYFRSIPKYDEESTTITEPTWRRKQATEDAHFTCSKQSQIRGGKINLVVGMGGSDSKLNFRKAVVQLTTKKTVREIMTTYFSFLWDVSYEFLRIRQFSGCDRSTWYIDNQLNEDNKLDHRSFSGCRSDRWHFLGTVLVRIGGEYQRRVHFDSCFGNQITTRRESFKFGHALLQGDQ